MNHKLDDDFLRAVWVTVYGTMMTGTHLDRHHDIFVLGHEASIRADAAVQVLKELEHRKIRDQQRRFKRGDQLTTQYGMCFGVVSVDYDKGTLTVWAGEEKPSKFKRVSDTGWIAAGKSKSDWPDSLDPYVFRLEDRPTILAKLKQEKKRER